MNKSEALLFWLDNHGKKSVRYIHDALCLQNPQLSQEKVAEIELDFGRMVKFTCDQIIELCLKQVDREQAEQAVKDAYPWLREKAFVKLWNYSQWVVEKCY